MLEKKEKDAIIVAMANRVTEVSVSVLDAVKEMRKSNEELIREFRTSNEALLKSTDELGAAMDNLSENVAALGTPPPK